MTAQNNRTTVSQGKGDKDSSYTYLGSFVDFIFISQLVHEHGSRLSILEHGGVHSEAERQCHERLLQGTAPHRAALRAHCRARFAGPVRTVRGASEGSTRVLNNPRLSQLLKMQL